MKSIEVKYQLNPICRSEGIRIKEFVQQQHSGGTTYARSKKVLAGQSEFSGHRLETRGMFLSVVETEMSFVSPSLIEY
jgi:hypothetical protein